MKEELLKGFDKKIYAKQYYLRNREKQLAHSRKQRTENRERYLLKQKEYYLKHKDKRLKRMRAYYFEHKEEIFQKRREWHKKRRLEALIHYSNNPIPVCACCGETSIEFLTFDHIDGKGAEHRKIVKDDIYLWMKRNNYPKGFRVLCYNCNCSRGFYGYCPHKKSKETISQHQ